ncbi:MAG: hypothetical protein QOD83_3934, partial [Solirubrobacteraceae bacterium]|nr:hypothetical protein [Solirubrobacteraceae bacterium]
MAISPVTDELLSSEQLDRGALADMSSSGVDDIDERRPRSDELRSRTMRHKSRGSRTGERVAVVFVTAISLAFAVVSLPWQPLEVDVVAAVAVCVAAALCWSLRPAQRPTRIAVIGRQRAVVALIEELEINGIADHTTVGWIATDRCVVPAFPCPQA